MPRSTTKSSHAARHRGARRSSTTPASASASTAPVGSLRADSAMIVCEIFGRRPDPLEERDEDRRIGGREHRADQEAGRERQAEGRRGDEPGRSSAVMITPGTTSSPSPTATRLRTRVESWRPPWKRMNETPSVSSELRAHRVERHVDRAGDRRAEQRCRRRAGRASAGSADESASELRHQPCAEHEREREDDVLRRSSARILHRRHGLGGTAGLRTTLGRVTAVPADRRGCSASALWCSRSPASRST